jgi:hypothetical protein
MGQTFASVARRSARAQTAPTPKVTAPQPQPAMDAVAAESEHRVMENLRQLHPVIQTTLTRVSPARSLLIFLSSYIYCN